MKTITSIELAAVSGGLDYGQRAPADIALGRTVIGGALFAAPTWLGNRIAEAVVTSRFKGPRVQTALGVTRWVTTAAAGFEGGKLGLTGHY